MKIFLLIISIIEFAIILIGIKVSKISMQKAKKHLSFSDKHLKLYLLLNKWLHLKRKNKRISDYLTNNHYLSVIIYGVNTVGEQVIEELKGSGIEIVCGIDQNADKIHADIKVIKPTDNIPDADAIIVTAISDFMQIDEMLHDKVLCPVISLEDIIYSM